jgi:hypothetical protein
LRWKRFAPELLVVLVAFVARLAVPLTGGGFHGFMGADPAVYYTAAVAVTYGELPYRDFILVHPPVVPFALQPAAWVGRLTTDHTGLIVGNLIFTLIGALCAGLVVRIARVWGLGTPSAVAGGLFYAIWLGSVQSEYASRLEPLGNAFILAAVLALAHARPRSGGTERWSGRLAVVAGASLGLAVNTKIWWGLPAVVILAWSAIESRDRRFSGLLLAGAVGVSLLLDGALFAMAPREMWTDVVRAQLGRPRRYPDLGFRLEQLGHVGGPLLTTLFWVLLAVALVLALTVGATRLHAVLLGLQTSVLLVSPSFFPEYADYIAPAAALTVAGAASVVWQRRAETSRPIGRVAVVLAVAGLAVVGGVRLVTGHDVVGHIAERESLIAAAADRRCIMAEVPMNLVIVDALDRSFADGCHNTVDVRGHELTLERRGPKNSIARQWLVGYLRQGDSILLRRHSRLTFGRDPALRPVTVLAYNGDYMLFIPPP